ncbi:hypothetical protein ACQYEX_003940 [Salmonella enterica]|uniref:hypothetical protein n=1 Tax=Salmonella enterica TaxID=28901 RepID=UPI0009AF96E8|nr:hypothetical protein [Salmonella enterica]EBW9942541.1 hypothetical protein [Salmonella enterica subsp. enterica serovar Give]EBX0572080.1 hypothetical protein [Salmonella enterica subsp. enterica serovar Utah]ECA5183672.1 hypothetical protein [Salmonella enterica subsp. enterica serovar Newport]ECB3943303.1 hypothetical protein [Salmonella enterica subsp. enterica serovar Stanley]ECC3380017.1 hypothetical protein [Salmonella enterica subsp. enterica serovar Manchester]ECD3769687.1 hypothe
MTDIKRSDLFYDDYSWTVLPGDDPTKTAADRNRFSRKEGYEVLNMLNSFKAHSLKEKLIVEWMIHECLPSHIQGRENVKDWIEKELPVLKPFYPR